MIPTLSVPEIDRAEINRANAQHSTGPKTPEGKQRSSLNALRHGLTGQIIVLPGDDLEAYQRHVESYVNQCKPKGAIEAQLVQTLADTAWRLNRVSALENNLLTLGMGKPGQTDIYRILWATPLLISRKCSDGRRPLDRAWLQPSPLFPRPTRRHPIRVNHRASAARSIFPHPNNPNPLNHFHLSPNPRQSHPMRLWENRDRRTFIGFSGRHPHPLLTSRKCSDGRRPLDRAWLQPSLLFPRPTRRHPIRVNQRKSAARSHPPTPR